VFALVMAFTVIKTMGVNNDPKYIFEKIHNQPVFKTICLP